MIANYIGFESIDDVLGAIRNSIVELESWNKLKKRFSDIDNGMINESDLVDLQRQFETDDIKTIQDGLLSMLSDLDEQFSDPGNFANYFDRDLTILKLLYRVLRNY